MLPSRIPSHRTLVSFRPDPTPPFLLSLIEGSPSSVTRLQFQFTYPRSQVGDLELIPEVVNDRQTRVGTINWKNTTKESHLSLVIIIWVVNTSNLFYTQCITKRRSFVSNLRWIIIVIIVTHSSLSDLFLTCFVVKSNSLTVHSFVSSYTPSRSLEVGLSSLTWHPDLLPDMEFPGPSASSEDCSRTSSERKTFPHYTCLKVDLSGETIVPHSVFYQPCIYEKDTREEVGRDRSP